MTAIHEPKDNRNRATFSRNANTEIADTQDKIVPSDIYSTAKRSDVMSRVKSRDTKTELTVRSTLHRIGYRFRVHRADLPGTPDIVLPKYRAIIFVNGCFWYQHQGCKRAKIPSSNSEFWRKKLIRNVERDRVNTRLLESDGWRVLCVWECETNRKSNEALEAKLREFLQWGEDNER